MRFIHTADWHIGKIVNDFSMLPYQEHALNQLIDLLKERKVDCLIIAGDLYDRSNPPALAMDLVDRTFNRILSETNTPILLISGNHDNLQFIEYGNYLTKSNGLYSEGLLKESITKVTIKDTDFYLFPFITPFQYSQLFDDASIKTYNDLFIQEMSKINLTNKQNVLITHGYFINDGNVFDKEDSVRPLSVGTAEYVEVNCFNKFDYVACGHLHSYHQIGSDRVQYSGSLLKYSKSEVNNKIGFNEVELIDNQLKVTRHLINPLKDMIIKKDTLENLLKQPTQDFVYYELLDTQIQLNAFGKLKAISPYAMGLTYENIEFNRIQSSKKVDDFKHKSIPDMFEEFYTLSQSNPLSETQKEIITKMLNHGGQHETN